jgi:hypothetical protein
LRYLQSVSAKTHGVVLILAAAACCVWAASAGAATVTVGSPITRGLDGGYAGDNGSTVTVANTALSEPGAHVTSPVSGTIVSWRAITTGTGEYALRVLRPGSGGEYTGAGRSPENVSSAGDHTFSANLAIQPGDLIGLDLPNNQGMSGAAFYVPAGVWSFWVPALPEDSTDPPFDSFTHAELAFNATVQYTEIPGGGSTAPTPTPTPATAKSKCKKTKKHKRSAESAKKKGCKKKKKHG